MATLARQKHNSQERQIAKALGLSDAQLAGLLRIRAGYWPGNAAAVLETKGLAFRRYEERAVGSFGYTQTVCVESGLTEAGQAMFRRARAMGY